VNEKTSVISMLRELPSQRGVSVENSRLGHGLQDLDAARNEHPDWGAFGILSRWQKNGSHFYATEIRFAVPGANSLQALVLGRHTQSDLRMIPYAAQRHAIILCWPPTGDLPPFLEAIDLFTTVGLGTPGNDRLTHVAGKNYLRFCTGPAHTLVLFAKPNQSFSDVLESDYGCDPEQSEGNDPDLPFSSQVDVKTIQSQIKGHSAQDVPTLISVGPDGDIDPRYAANTRLGSQPVVLPTRINDLVLGLLVGRHERCPGHQSFTQNNEISRVHYCLLSRRGQLWIVDAGSTNGTRVIRNNDDVYRLNYRRRTWLLGAGDLACIGGRDVFIGLPRQDYNQLVATGDLA
jgi:hypothetical protein